MSLLPFVELEGIAVEAEENADADDECGEGEADNKADYKVGIGSRV